MDDTVKYEGFDFGFDTSGLAAYSGYIKDPALLRQSASGGAATAFARQTILVGGCVYGVSYSDDFRGAEFCRIEDLEGLGRIKSSKYIRTKKQISGSEGKTPLFQSVAEDLASGRRVLFTGLGCDVGALLKYCEDSGTDTASLYTLELICNGPTHPEVAEQYISDLEKKLGSKIRELNVRYKKKYFEFAYLRAVTESGKVYEAPFYETDYGKAFVEYPIRQCFDCRYKGAGHPGDLVIGDYWGMDRSSKEYNPGGTSVIFVRTEKGREMIGGLDRDFFSLSEAPLEHALIRSDNYYDRHKEPGGLSRFERDFREHGLHYAVTNAHGAAYKIKRKIRSHLPKELRLKISDGKRVGRVQRRHGGGKG